MGQSAPDDHLVLPTAPTSDPDWVLVEDGFHLAREHEIESLFAVANGYVGTRGSLAEGSSMSAPATFIAGVFALLPHSSVPELVVAPDWPSLHAIVEGREMRLESGDVLAHRRVLDMRQGIFWREWRHRDATGHITGVLELRLASLADRHVLVQAVAFTPENYGGRVVLESSIDGPAGEEGPSEDRPFVAEPGVPSSASPGARNDAPRNSVLLLRVAGTRTEVAFAAAAQLVRVGDDRELPSVASAVDGVRHRWAVDVRIGQTYRFDRGVSVFTTRDTPRPADAAAAHIVSSLATGAVDHLVTAHVSAWDARWRTSDVVIEGDLAAQRALRFAVHHLIGAANPEDESVSVGARALTGPGYKGHVFWDTEIFMLPFYTFTHPPSARALLMYRYHTLPAARDKAGAAGYRGALYPWESADTGAEATPRVGLFPDGTEVEILTGVEEHHISADVAYAVWQYWQATGDDAFMRAAGAEIVLETARFWASRGALEADGRYHIRRVIGPDEYHESVDDDAYTNLMAQWNLERGVELAQRFATRWPTRWRDLVRALALTAAELREWQRLAEAMYTGFDPERGLYEQFAGYFDLEDIDLTEYEPRTVPIDVLLGRERVQQSKVIKQADVIMAIHLLWDRLPAAVREANFRYYEPRTSHGSSLSPAIHALVAARLGDAALGARYFYQAADIDLANNMGNAADGVHAAALGGLWQAAVFGFAGVRPRGTGLVMDPRLPPEWRALRFPIRWRGGTLSVTVAGNPLRTEVQLEGAGSVALALADGPVARLVPGRRYESARTSGDWGRWRERAT